MSNSSLPKVPELLPPDQSSIYTDPFDLAMLINGEVYQIMNLKEDTANLLLMNPKFVQIKPNQVEPGWLYDEESNTFSPPS